MGSYVPVKEKGVDGLKSSFTILMMSLFGFHNELFWESKLLYLLYLRWVPYLPRSFHLLHLIISPRFFHLSMPRTLLSHSIILNFERHVTVSYAILIFVIFMVLENFYLPSIRRFKLMPLLPQASTIVSRCYMVFHAAFYLFLK